uniref:Uncharacterized protein n=1 Tax=Arundo donax TaxID=35708 RepID=A0A0A9BXJ4_ARUDO
MAALSLVNLSNYQIRADCNPSMGSLTLLCLHGVPFGPQDDLDKRRHSGLCMDHQTPTSNLIWKD